MDIEYINSHGDCCNSKLRIKGCAAGVSYLLILDETTNPATSSYVNLVTGAISATAPVDFVTGDCPPVTKLPYDAEEVCVTATSTGTTTNSPFRVESAWSPELDGLGDPTGNQIPAFTEVRPSIVGAPPAVQLTIVSSNATSFTASGTAFGITWDVVTFYNGGQVLTITANGTIQTVTNNANDGVSLSYGNVVVTTTTPGVLTTSQKWQIFNNDGTISYLNADNTVYTLPAGATITIGKCPIVVVPKIVSVLACDNTSADTTVDSVSGVYVLNQSKFHTETVYETITATFGGTINYSQIGLRKVRVSRGAATLTNDSVIGHWTDFGDGFSSSEFVSEHEYPADGTYEIKNFYLVSGGQKILAQTKKIEILNGVQTFTPAILNQPLTRTYQVLVRTLFQNYCDRQPISLPYDAQGVGINATITARLPVVIDELEDNADFQAAIATPPIVPVVISSGGVSIAEGTFAATLGPNGTTWSPSGDLKSVTIRARKSNANDATTGAANRIEIATPTGTFILLTDESITFSVQDNNTQLINNVTAFGNSAALITFNAYVV